MGDDLNVAREQIRESLEHHGKYFRYYSVIKSCWWVLNREVTKQKKEEIIKGTIQENFPKLNYMNFQIEKVHQKPSMVNGNRSIISHLIKKLHIGHKEMGK